jgi:hypothetical protein
MDRREIDCEFGRANGLIGNRVSLGGVNIAAEVLLQMLDYLLGLIK